MFGMLLVPTHDHAQPRSRGDPRRHRLRRGGADAAAGAARPARRRRQPRCASRSSGPLGRAREPRGPVLAGDRRPRAAAARRSRSRSRVRGPARVASPGLRAEDRRERRQRRSPTASPSKQGYLALQQRLSRRNHRPGPRSSSPTARFAARRAAALTRLQRAARRATRASAAASSCAHAGRRRRAPRASRSAATRPATRRSPPCATCARRSSRRRSPAPAPRPSSAAETAENVDYFDAVTQPGAVRVRVRARAVSSSCSRSRSARSSSR